MLSFSLLFVLLFFPASLVHCNCECDEAGCSTPEGCLAGLRPDSCGCCQVCGRTENQLCDMDGIFKYGVCGDNLDCVVQKDNEHQAICSCQTNKMVCGDDGVTYSTICSLNEESIRRGQPDKYNPQLSIDYWGPCKSGPVIISPPENVSGPYGANLTLSCEATGYPAPTITWQFVSTEGKTISLPSDDQSVAIQMRGGPEPLMVTGWAQIMSLDPSYIGVYHCIASNSGGQAFAFAKVGVYMNEL